MWVHLTFISYPYFTFRFNVHWLFSGYEQRRSMMSFSKILSWTSTTCRFNFNNYSSIWSLHVFCHLDMTKLSVFSWDEHPPTPTLGLHATSSLCAHGSASDISQTFEHCLVATDQYTLEFRKGPRFQTIQHEKSYAGHKKKDITYTEIMRSSDLRS